MSPIARRLVATGYAIGLVSAGVAWVLFAAWLAPDPGPAATKMAPIVYRTNELAPSTPRETWVDYKARMEAEGKPYLR